VIAYRAMLDVPRELAREVAKLLRAERRACGTRVGSMALTCWNEALMALAWFRNQADLALVGAGFGCRAPAYGYRDEVVKVLAEQAPDLHDVLTEVSAAGWSHVVLDGKVFRTDRCAETTLSAKGETINAWYSGKHRAPGGNVQAIMRARTVADLGFRRPARPPPRHDLRVSSECSAPCTRRRPSSTCPRSPTPVTTALARASTPDQAARRRSGPRPGQPGLQHTAAFGPLPRGTRIRPAHRPLASPPARHRQPPQNRRLR
jgi:hypothetical protein